MTERWLPVPGFEGRYEVSDAGRIKSVARTETIVRHSRHVSSFQQTRFKCEKILAQCDRGNGYRCVRLLGRSQNVHQLVLRAFRGEAPVGLIGCHADGNKKNNSLENLRWDTYSANNAERFGHGMKPVDRRGGRFVKREATPCV